MLSTGRIARLTLVVNRDLSRQQPARAFEPTFVLTVGRRTLRSKRFAKPLLFRGVGPLEGKRSDPRNSMTAQPHNLPENLLSRRKGLSAYLPWPFLHRGYKRFIVLTRSRTGSNMLISFLNSHPHVCSRSEVFAKIRKKRYEKALAGVFCRMPFRVKAVGFKIFYYHPLDRDGAPLWRNLVAMRNLHVIHLKRQNTLRALLSKKIATMQDAWFATDETSQKDAKEKSVDFTVDELREGFEETANWQKEYAQLFRDHPILDITYEDMVAQPEEEFSRVTQFLGLRFTPPSTHLRRQNPERMSHLISNYAELKTAFTNTEWEGIFED
jgi:LPS sulfotransferase NodH